MSDLVLPTEDPQALRHTLRELDTYFETGGADRDRMADALWAMNFPAGHENIERKWGSERIDPPAGSTPLALATARFPQAARKANPFAFGSDSKLESVNHLKAPSSPKPVAELS